MAGRMNNIFLINAPAGSGKTTHIENRIIDLLAKCPKGKILAITYTNRAKDELQTRVDSKNVTIDTIHSFLSKFISRYFSRAEVVDLYFKYFSGEIEKSIAKGDSDTRNARYIEKYGELSFDVIKKNLRSVSYNEQPYSAYYYGRISHDDLLRFTGVMFEEFTVLRKRLSDKYAYIFIDEYQDTSADVLNLFYQSVFGTNSQLYLLGDKMQEIYDNYDGSFEDELSMFNEDHRLSTNYRCSPEIVTVLNGLYNNKRFSQTSNRSCNGKSPTILLTDVESETFVGQFNDHMQLYVFNRSRFERVGVKDLYQAISGMEAYCFPSRYTVVDVLTGQANDNPDKLFRILFTICDFIIMIDSKAYGRAIRLAREKGQIFQPSLTDIQFHEDKAIFFDRMQLLKEKYTSENFTILDFCRFLISNEYCMPETLRPFIENEDYLPVLDAPLHEIVSLYSYLNEPRVSTQHGVKGEGHDKVCFIAEDSRRTPVVHMYDYFRLLSTQEINLTDFQRFYYNYTSVLNSIDLKKLSSAPVYEDHKDEFVKRAQDILNRYNENQYFAFSELEFYDKYLNSPGVTNARQCFKLTRVKGVLWAYKLFYVGCSRAKNNLSIIVDENKVSSFREEFIEKMISIGFSVE